MKRIFLQIRKYFLYSGQKEKIFITSIFLLGLIFIFVSYLFAQKEIKPKYGGRFIEGIYENVNTLNPFVASKENEKAILNIIYPPLIEFQSEKIISKYLKSYFISPDSLTYQIELKDNLKWSDGTKITTDDLFFSFSAFQKYSPPEIKNFFQNIELKILDKNKAEFVLKSNDNYFFYRLSYLNILPSKKFSESNILEIPWSTFRVGSGPFVFDSISEKGDIKTIKLKRNPYYQPKPYLDEILFYIYPSSKRAFDALLLKEISGLAGLSYFKLPSNLFSHYQIEKLVLPRVIGIFFNSQKIKKEDVEFLEKNLNRKEIIGKIFQGYGEESKGILSSTLRKIFNLPEPEINIQTQTPSLTKINIILPSVYFYPDLGRYLKEKFKFDLQIVGEDEIKKIIEEKNYTAILYGLNLYHPPSPFFFWSQAGININNISDSTLEKEFQKLISDSKVNFSQELSLIEKNILDSKNNVFLLNPYYLYIISKKMAVFIPNYLTRPDLRFSLIEYWYQK